MAGSNQASNALNESLAGRMVSDAVADNADSLSAGQADASHSLWQAVYENPGKTALVVGGSALVVGAVVASRGKIAEFIPGLKNKVLVVEDSPFFGPAFKETL